jgi:hypothetical protein
MACRSENCDFLRCLPQIARVETPKIGYTNTTTYLVRCRSRDSAVSMVRKTTICTTEVVYSILGGDTKLVCFPKLPTRAAWSNQPPI